MSDTGHSDEPDDRVVAAEYVLGLLGSAERRVADERLASDLAFVAQVEFWEERLSGLADAVRPVTPPDRVWANIAQAVAPPPEPDDRKSLWNSLVFWRPFALGCAVAAAASVGVLTYVELLPKPRAPMLATLGISGGQPGFVAAVGGNGRSLVVVPAALLTGDQRAMELWLIPAGDKPHSLGLIEPGRPVTLTVPPELQARLTTDAVLAVSLEPPGGSPTGAPTGPVIANGKLTSL